VCKEGRKRNDDTRDEVSTKASSGHQGIKLVLGCNNGRQDLILGLDKETFLLLGCRWWSCGKSTHRNGETTTTAHAVDVLSGRIILPTARIKGVLGHPRRQSAAQPCER
jgi:hypothetical protein